MNKINARLRAELLETAFKAVELDLMPMTQGNLSVRDTDTGLIAVTPHDLPFTEMTDQDIVVVDVKGNQVEGDREMSAETPVHLAVYEGRKECDAIVHAEPIFTNAFGVLHMPIEPVYVNMAIDVGGRVPVMPFADSGSWEFGREMLKVMGDRNAVIWANHGMLSVGRNLAEALHCAFNVEMAAKIYSIALQHGTPFSIDQEKIDSLIG
jgi:ribulose-5-phosphate 4-epimerase/fuculose-1-phosphate aldolase